jgi:Domain of unknown function (DUF4062)
VSVELPGDVVIRTPDQRLRVFVSSTLGELADERRAVLRAVSTLRLTPVLFELGADGFEEAFAAGSRLHQREAVSRRAGPARRRPPGVRAAEIWGWAWADGGVASVGVRISDETAWQSADLEPPRGREWQRFSLAWTPRHPGPTLIASRAQALTGERQPIAGRRNAIHSVAVSILCP